MKKKPKPTKRWDARHAARTRGRKVFGGLILKELAAGGIMGNASLIYEKMPPHLSLPTVYHKKTAEIVYCLGGHAIACLDGRNCRLSPGTVLLIPPGVRHRFITRSQSCESLSIFHPALRLKARRPDIHTEIA